MRDSPNCANLPRHRRRLLVRDRVHPPLAQPVDRLWVLAQVELGTDEDDGDVGGVVTDLGVPLCAGHGRDKWGSVRRPAMPRESDVAATRDFTSPEGGADRLAELTLVRTFSKLGGLTTEKQMRKTSVCG